MWRVSMRLPSARSASLLPMLSRPTCASACWNHGNRMWFRVDPDELGVSKVGLQFGSAPGAHTHPSNSNKDYNFVTNNGDRNADHDTRHRKFVDLIQQAGVDSEQVLDVAVSSRRFDMMKVLLNHSKENDAKALHTRMDDKGETILFRACSKGDYEMAKEILEFDSSEQHIIYESRSLEGCTPLMEACGMGHMHIVKLLLETSSSIKHLLAKSKAGETALSIATHQKHRDIEMMLRDLIERHQHKMEKEARIRANLRSASAEGELDAVDNLIAESQGSEASSEQQQQKRKPRGPLLEKNEDGLTALRLACKDGHVDVVRRLLEQDNSLEHVMSLDNDGRTALMSACNLGNIEIVKLLLQTNSSDAHLAARNPKTSLTALHWAVANRKLDLVKLLLATNSSRRHLMAPDNKGLTPLMTACLAVDLPMVTLLLKVNSTGTHVMEQSNDGRTALICVCSAAGDDQVEIAQAMLQQRYGRELCTFRDNQEWSALTWAACTGQGKLVQVLLETNDSSPMVMAVDKEGWTPLMWACYLGQIVTTKQLLRTDYSNEMLLLQCPAGWNALMCASVSGNLQLVKILLEHNSTADHITAVNVNGMTAAQLAKKCLHPEIAELLLDSEVDAESKKKMMKYAPR